MDMFLYLDLDTCIHKLDPRTKILALFTVFICAILLKSIFALVILCVLVITCAALAKCLLNLKRIKIVLIMIALLSVVIWALTLGGKTRLLGPITLEGIMFGISSAIKFDTMIIAGMIFLSTTKMEEISIGLVKMKVPYRGAFAFSTAIRLVPSIVATSETIIQAQKSRGLDMDSGNIFQKIRKFVPLLIPTLVSVIRNTNVFSMALESKGFGYSDARTSYLEIKYSSIDYMVLLLCLLGIAVSVLAKVKFKM